MTEVEHFPSGQESFSLSQDLFLDFEAELASLLRPSSEAAVSSSSSSGGGVAINVRRTSSGSGEGEDPEFDTDGTLPCSRLSFDVLCNISGRSSLEQLKTLTLCVSCQGTADSLRLLATYTPQLSTLKLDHSKFTSLRVLGEELRSLKTLSVCGCGLTNLDGITHAPNLEMLVAADNAIQDLLPVTELRKLHTIDLEDNGITNYDAISFLFLCNNLEDLVLRGNPICQDSDYRSRIFRYLPGLKNLDVTVTPRASKEFCRRNRKPHWDEDRNNPGAGALITQANEAQELGSGEAVVVAVPCSHESSKTASTNDELIRKLIKQTSVEDEKKRELRIESRKEEMVQALMLEQESLRSISEDTKAGPESLELSMEIEEFKDEAVDISAHGKESNKQDKDPISVPSTAMGQKLLTRRKSFGPARIADYLSQDEDNDGDQSLSEQQVFGVPGYPGTAPVTTTPDLSKFMANLSRRPSYSNSSSAALVRPESSASLSSVATTTDGGIGCSESDSGIDSSAKSSIVGGGAKSKLSVGGLPKIDPKGKLLTKMCSTDQENDGQTIADAKTNKFIGLARQNSNLEGVKTTQGDIEIEDFDEL